MRDLQMSQHRLVEVSESGLCKEIANGQNPEELKDACDAVRKKNPDIEYGIVDENGYFIWFEKKQGE
ncbi:MAG: hypothetical protein GX847_08045 [Clostridiales bacterium]|nr:hypothetical protein [Clostridiales bacterium]